jgi:hypothetical protein
MPENGEKVDEGDFVIVRLFFRVGHRKSLAQKAGEGKGAVTRERTGRESRI